MTPFRKARIQEQANRELAYFPKVPPLCGFPVVPFTARHKLELRANANAFLCRVNMAPLRGDVFEFLWRLNPNFRRPDGATPNHHDGKRRRSTRFAAWLMRRLIARRIKAKSFDLFAAIRQITDRLEQVHQDQPGVTNANKEGESDLQPDQFWLDQLMAHFCSSCHWRPEDVLDAPLQQLFQIYRQSCLNLGVSLPFIAPSDALYGKEAAP